MIYTTVPTGVRALTDRFKDLFCIGTAGSYCNLSALFCYFLLQKNSLSEFVRSCPWTHSVSDLSRSILCFDKNRFMRRLRHSILRRYNGQISPEHFCWAIDDTDNPKYGKTIFRSGPWYSSKGIYNGQKIMVLALVDIKRGIALPIAYAIASKKDDPYYRSGPDLAVDLLKSVLAENFPKLPAVMDSWFDSSDLMDKLKEIGITYAGEMKSNRNVKTNPGPFANWTKFSDVFANQKRFRTPCRLDSLKVKRRQKKAKCSSTILGYIKNRKSPLKMTAIYNRRNSKSAFAYYASTDLSMSGARIWELSRARWKIECLFRDLKQCLSFGHLPIGGEKAADLAVCLPFILLVSLRLDGSRYWNVTSDKSIGDMTDQIREIGLTKAIDHLTRGNDSALISRFKARRDKGRLNKKPVNVIAEAS